MRNITVCGVITEKLCLTLESIYEILLDVDILLTTVDDTNETEFKGIDASSKDVQSVGPSIHQIEFGQDTDGPATLWINGTSQFQGIRIREIDISSRDCKNDTRQNLGSYSQGGGCKVPIRVRNVVEDKVSNLSFNITGLVSNRNLTRVEHLKYKELDNRALWSNPADPPE